MREIRQSGSVRGVRRNLYPYRDYRDLRGSQKGEWPGQQRTEMEFESARREWLFNIAQV